MKCWETRMPLDEQKERSKALDIALLQIEKQFGKGSIMRLGQSGVVAPVDSIPTGSISIDYALGIGGVPRGRVVEIFGPESSGKTTLALQVIAQVHKTGGMAAFVDAEREVASVEEALAGARDILAEWISEDAEVRAELRRLFQRKGIFRSTLARGKETEAQK